MLVRLENFLRPAVELCQDQWFDRTRGVRTSGNVALSNAGIAQVGSDSELYVPARPAHIRHALSQVPVRDFSSYSYVDLGSGKGRSLFVAAELPFRQIIGVELSKRLHEQACSNIRRFRFRQGGCRRIESVHQNAVDYNFPDNELVLYLFNPFGAATTQQVLNNLQATLERNPRHVAIVLLWPRCGDQVLQIPGMHLVNSISRLQIFEAYPASRPKPPSFSPAQPA